MALPGGLIELVRKLLGPTLGLVRVCRALQDVRGLVEEVPLGEGEVLPRVEDCRAEREAHRDTKERFRLHLSIPSVPRRHGAHARGDESSPQRSMSYPAM